jgi:hypothetical protein
MSGEFEQEAQTPATVKPSLGYPNDRVEASPTPIGWHGLEVENLTYVSRETTGENK